MTAIELIIDAVRTLSAREQQVLSMLYGFGGEPQHSSEALSLQLNAPLKTIVKTEAAALRKLRHPIPRKTIMKALEEGEQEIWSSLSLSGDLVLKKDIPSGR
jgi:DNA-directed RNA polymerase sigma subunit (sigma70/sigma32)